MTDHVYATRRAFMRNTLTTLSLSATVPAFLLRPATALAARKAKGGPILVVIQLSGGNDGLNTVVPFRNDDYHRARKNLAIDPDTCLNITDTIGLHPALDGLMDLLQQQRLAVIQGAGYPNPNRSHFASMDIWHTADPAGKRKNGWIGRYFDQSCRGCDPPPKSAIALQGETPLALQGERFQPLAFASPNALTWRPMQGGRPAAEAFENLLDAEQARQQPTGNPSLDFLRRASLDARLNARQIQNAARKSKDLGRETSSRLHRDLAQVLQLIAAGLPTTVYYLSHTGFDTHANQKPRHARLLKQFADALKWFNDRLAEHRLADRVMVLTFSEFGRRVAVNASGGTDHGAAAPMFLMGPRLRPGLHFDHPSLTNLDNGDLRHQVDFRDIYAEVLTHWLGAQPHTILHHNAKPLKLFA